MSTGGQNSGTLAQLPSRHLYGNNPPHDTTAGHERVGSEFIAVAALAMHAPLAQRIGVAMGQPLAIRHSSIEFAQSPLGQVTPVPAPHQAAYCDGKQSSVSLMHMPLQKKGASLEQPLVSVQFAALASHAPLKHL